MNEQQSHYERLSQQLSEFVSNKRKAEKSRRSLLVTVADLTQRLQRTDPEQIAQSLLTYCPTISSAASSSSSISANGVAEPSPELIRAAHAILSSSGQGRNDVVVGSDPISTSLASDTAFAFSPSSPSSVASSSRLQQLTQPQLIALSLGQLDSLHTEVQSLSAGEHIEFRQQAVSLLTANLAMRRRMNEYAEHLLVLTQRKLEMFDQQS